MTRPSSNWRDGFIPLLMLALGAFGWWLMQLSSDVRILREEVATNRVAILEIEPMGKDMQLLAQQNIRLEEQHIAIKEQIKALLEAK